MAISVSGVCTGRNQYDRIVVRRLAYVGKCAGPFLSFTFFALFDIINLVVYLRFYEKGRFVYGN